MPFKNYCVLSALSSLSSDGELEGKHGNEVDLPLQIALLGGRQGL